MEVYLDNSATTRVRKEVIEKMVEVLEKEYGNPSSLHLKGYQAEKLMKEARENVAKLINGDTEGIVFTSGGTESNNLALIGVAESLRKKGNHIISSTIEHPSVLNVLKYLEENGFEVTYLDVDKTGKVDIENLKRTITDKTILVSIMAVNNEIGTIEPIQEIGEVAKERDIIFHVDAIQAVGKINVDVKKQNLDMVSLSSHKIHGPKGVGALYIDKSVKIRPIIFGGGQEKNLRSGTENMPGIAGFGVASKLAQGNFHENASKLMTLKKRLYEGIFSEIKDVHLNGPKIEEGAPHILNISFAGIRGEVLLHALEEKGIYVSTGSACSSKKKGQSHVLKAIGLKEDLIESAIRFSFGIFNTEEEIDYTISVLKEKVNFLRKYKRR
ncbi:cysteine desulfurase [Thermoanaerobacter uzonensis DSM 18761]|uniref:cysteine desulfurase n=1 Tax=Thermoanaerobacter uzonensis DSM 18761 TaxID=1123369 RepID=A0A1M4WSK4_9THEO|nr:cysteine desulfurase family protein [Thermoanaerobacter uzonensis]SHE84137.1 cysteine desulfurase [Thermoanaerobacter uzonensis DSM 18761]